MTFTQIPQQYAPLGGELRYTLVTEEAATFDLRIADAGNGTLIGAKRFAGATSASFDAAPYLRRAVRFTPTTGATGFRAADRRTVLGYIEAETVQFPAPSAAAGNSTAETAAGVAACGKAGSATPDNEEPGADFQATGMLSGEKGVGEADIHKPLSGEKGVGNGARNPLPANTPAVSPLRTFLPCRATVTAPALLTAMPAERLISPGECDELTLFPAEACTVTVTAQAGATTTAESYRTTKGGPYLFRLDMRDFPEAEALTVDAGACGTVVYTVVPAVLGARRLAWRSSAGSIEHYTFPIEKSATVETAKKRAYGTDGHLAVTAGTERRTTLVSAYEPRATLEALAGILASPDVWLAGETGYTPVDVMTEQAVIHRHGAVACMEIEIRPRHKTGMPWN